MYDIFKRHIYRHIIVYSLFYRQQETRQIEEKRSPEQRMIKFVWGEKKSCSKIILVRKKKKKKRYTIIIIIICLIHTDNQT